MSKYTPGPWRYDPHDTLNPDRAGGIVVDLPDDYAEQCGVPHATMVIAEVCVAQDDVARADGDLIAAAPDLYEALRYALRFMPPSADTSVIHKALDKAEGKS